MLRLMVLVMLMLTGQVVDWKACVCFRLYFMC